MTPNEKFHPSKRHWPGGVPDSIAETEHKKVTGAGWLDHENPPTLNLVHVYCPNKPCDYHVRVDEKVREYNLTGHLLTCKYNRDTCRLERYQGDPLCETCKREGSCRYSGDTPRKPQEAVSREDSPGSDGFSRTEGEALRTAPTRSGGVNLLEETLAGGPLASNFEEEKTSRHPNSARFHEVLAELAELHDRKQADYGRGDDPFANVRSSDEWGIAPWVGAMVRLNDKVHRLQSLNTNGDLNNEAAEDSFRDIAIYAVIALVLYEQSLEQTN